MRVLGLAGVLCALLLAAGALGGREVDSTAKGLPAAARDVFLKWITKSCWKDLSKCVVVLGGVVVVVSVFGMLIRFSFSFLYHLEVSDRKVVVRVVMVVLGVCGGDLGLWNTN